MIRGESAYICNVCIETCVDVLHGEESKKQADAGSTQKANLKYIHQFVSRHFHPLHPAELVTATREFPLRMRPDIQAALDTLLGAYYNTNRFTGIHSSYSQEGIKFSDLLQEGQYAPTIAPARYDEIDIGEVEPVRCLNNGLWIGDSKDTRYALLYALKRDYMGGGSVHIEIIVPPGEAGNQLTRHYFRELEQAVNQASAYRGKVLSLERQHPYSGKSSEVLVHKLPGVMREDVILPAATLAALDRNVIEFSRIKPQLANLHMPVKKGILLYGPPGTGKTHSIKYIAHALKGHTTLLITADQIGYLGEYMLLARLLQPAIVVIEDVDLIAQQRDQIHDAGVESLLNKLLNEMDGLKENNDVLFVLTTNRPQVLEEALAERPGRVDQAIEFPLPDAESRRRLARLYARDLPVSDELYDLIIARTDNVSPAFIKELMRRIAQNLLLENNGNTATAAHVNAALAEMLFTANKLNMTMLGKEASE